MLEAVVITFKGFRRSCATMPKTSSARADGLQQLFAREPFTNRGPHVLAECGEPLLLVGRQGSTAREAEAQHG